MFGFDSYMRYVMATWSTFLSQWRGEKPAINTAVATDESLRMGNEVVRDGNDSFMDELKEILAEPIPKT